MRKAFLDTALVINAKRQFSKQELFELMKENFGDKFGAITYTEKKFLGTDVSSIYINTVDGWVSVDLLNHKINVGLGMPLNEIKKGFLGLKFDRKEVFKMVLWVILCIITLGLPILIAKIVDGFRMIFHLEGTKKNRVMMKTIALEIEKLVKK